MLRTIYAVHGGGMNAAEIEAWLKPHAIAWTEEDGRMEFHGWVQGVATVADVNDGTPGIAYEDGCAMAREDLEGAGVYLDDDHVHSAVHHGLDVLRSRAAASDARLGAEAGTESEDDDE